MPKLTYGDLLAAAQSSDSNVRKRAYEAFQAWIKVAPQLSVNDRLSQTERHMLGQIFAQKGFAVPGVRPGAVPRVQQGRGRA